MKMTIAINGYGRMGKAVERIVRERGHEIVAIFDHKNAADPERLARAEVVIDFSSAEAIDDLVAAACEAGTRLVVGTTGWNDRLDAVRKRIESSDIALVHAANFSPGANILFALSRRAAELAGRFGYETGIEERHHSKKRDAPSGTALRIAREVELGGMDRPGVVSSRVGSEFGLHTLFFDSPDDLIELSHRARGRDGFARGAVIAAELLREKKGFFSFEELMESGS